MPDHILYQFLGAEGYSLEKVDRISGAIVLVVRQARKTYCCSACGSKRVYGQGKIRRLFRTVPIGLVEVYVEFSVPRVRCLDCQTIRQVDVPLAEGKRRYTKLFEEYVLELLRIATTRHVADLLGVGWDLVRDIERRHLQKYFSRPSLKKVRRIAIDEIAVRKGHQYLTLVLDLDTGRVVYVAKGRKTGVLNEFWKRMKAAGAKLKAAATDMWKPYINSVLKHFPKASLVFDRFHIMKLFGKRLTALRRDLFREATDAMQRKVLKGTRWLILMNSENLDEEKRQDQRLKDALSLNKPLATAYYLKEEFRQFWEQPGPLSAEFFLDDWCARAESSELKSMQSLAKLFRGYKNGLLAWFKHPISTGPLEGLNNKIKTLKRAAYGYRNLEYFGLKILALHRTRHALVG